jgi:hypothetical protein
MTFRTTASAAALALALGLIGTVGAAQAQDAGGFEAAQIEAFAEAAVVVQAINAEYSERLQAATDAVERSTIAEEANARAVEAVEEVDGITVAVYNAIADATREDAALAERVNAEIAALMQ